ncbi:MAG: HIRAN domain-containing protein [Gammaproteobacteria bacterium]|nr:HIRAN domain-containing protein [Gammaproteobacteria bacterium]
MKSLFVAWQDSVSRQWAPVGRLSHDEGKYRFVYTQGAKSSLFIPFGRMTDLNAEYVSDELFPLFANRILAKSRPEYDRYMNWLGLERSSHDAFDELVRTGGLRATDSLELFPYPQPTFDDCYQAHFFCRGLRYFDSESQTRAAKLGVDEALFLMSDLQNEHDSMALVLRTGDPMTLVGYVPRYFSTEFTELLRIVGADQVKVSVKKVNPQAPLQYRLLCRITAPWPKTFRPCEGGVFQSLAR